MKNKGYVISELAGCAGIIPAAVWLHFVFRRYGVSALSILFGAVNESGWEHVKVISAAYIAYAILELLWIKVSFHRYVAVKVAVLYLLMAAAIVLGYGCRLVFGEHPATVDILVAGVLIIAAQALSCRLMTSGRISGDYFAPAVFLLLLYYLMFFSFTIYPPRFDLFRDPDSGGFGYVEKLVEKRLNP